MSEIARIDILLSTYNGEDYLQAQLDSLLLQDFTDWKLLIRDDISTDRTLEIILSFIALHPTRAFLVDNGGQNLGPKRSFSALLNYSHAEYVMFCDQDDVWHPCKIRKTFEKMRELVAANGDRKPLLVHSDLTVVDEKLEVIANSFWAYAGLRPQNGAALSRELVMNVVTGCAMMINRAACDLALPIPATAIMHDWWIALVVAGTGKSAYITQPLTLYRQHGRNALGAKKYTFAALLGKLTRAITNYVATREENRRNLRIHYLQGVAFFHRFHGGLPPREQMVARAYLRMFSALPVLRFYWMWRYGLWRSGCARNLLSGLCFIRRSAIAIPDVVTERNSINDE